MKKRIVDPDFGEFDIEGPVPTREEFERTARRISEAARSFRAWPPGAVAACPNCGQRAFVGRDDLSHEVAKRDGLLVFRHLRGARCESCGVQSLEAEDLVAVEQEAGVELVADYEAKVSNIGSGTVGTYWPKDVVRVMRLGPNRRLFIKVIDADTALVKVDRRRPRAEEGPNRRPRAGRRGRSPEGRSA